MDSPLPKFPTKHDLAADIRSRIPALYIDANINAESVIETLLGPVYQALHEAQIKITLLKSQRDHLVKLEEQQRMRVNELRDHVGTHVEMHDNSRGFPK